MARSKEIHAAIQYIEQNLCEPLSLDNVANEIGLSKYYFHRTFQREVGIPIYDYIRRRRLANAASLLLHTQASILDIALNFHFGSQEAFTRAFKSIYQLPPGQYRTAVKHLITGGNEMGNKTKIKGWITTGTAPEKYEMKMDHAIYHMGTKSATIKSLADKYEADEYGTIMQQFSAKNYLGKRVCFSAFVKTAEVTGWCGLWLRIDTALSVTLKLDNMQDRAIVGTTEWNHYCCVLDVPENAAILNIGILLAGEGQVWLDQARFEEVDLNTPTTEFVPEDVFPDMPQNLSFEQ